MRVIAVGLPMMAVFAMACLGGFALLLGLNGFSGDEASSGLLVFVALAIVSVLVAGGVSYARTGVRIANASGASARLGSTPLVGALLGVVAGAIVLGLAFFVTVGLASNSRANRTPGGRQPVPVYTGPGSTFSQPQPAPTDYAE
jgi:hypothetical protein